MTVTVYTPGGTVLLRWVCFPGSPVTDNSDSNNINNMMMVIMCCFTVCQTLC